MMLGKTNPTTHTDNESITPMDLFEAYTRQSVGNGIKEVNENSFTCVKKKVENHTKLYNAAGYLQTEYNIMYKLWDPERGRKIIRKRQLKLTQTHPNTQTHPTPSTNCQFW